jgi:SAM-dependent methyltransferase
MIVTDFDKLDLPADSFNAIYAFESIGYTKDLDAWLARCWHMLRPGGRLLIRSPGSLDHCRSEHDFRSVTAFFDNWRYNFVGANLLVHKLRRLGFGPIRYRRLQFWAWGLTWNFIQHMLLWKYRLKMRTFIELEWIIWRTSKTFVFGNPYNIVLATKPLAGDDAMTGAQASYLKTLSEQAHDPEAFDETLTKAEGARSISRWSRRASMRWARLRP